jgi:glycosyltransferase involved in cell wall biosynthesis
MVPMLVFCSVVTLETLPAARVLARGLRAHHSDARVIACMVGSAPRLGPGEPFDVIGPHLLFAGRPTDGEPPPFGVDALAAPLLEWTFAQGAEVVVYLSPTVAVYGPLEPAIAVARERGVMLARRVEHLPEDGKRPSAADLVAAGPVTAGFVAAAGPKGERFARWWATGIAQSGAPLRWLEIAPGVFPEATWLEDPGAGLSAWNLHERPLDRQGDEVLAGGQPLRFIDFAGFRADRPYLLSDYATRVSPLDDPVLADLCGQYAERLQAAGWGAPEAELGLGERLGNGWPLDPLLRQLWTEARAAGIGIGDPSSPLAAEAFARWLREPGDRGGGAGVNRYLNAIYESRPDLQAAFPNLDVDGGALIGWAWEQGREEHGLLNELLPDAGPASADAHLTVNVFGYLRDTLGLAEAARLYITGLEAAGVPVTTTAVAPDLVVDIAEKTTVTRYGNREYENIEAPFDPAFNIVCLNGDQLSSFVQAGGGPLLADRRTIGVWGWETDVLPPSWQRGFQYVDEVWVYSTFVAQNLARLLPIPVVVIPPGMQVPDPSGVRLDLLNDGQFTFLFMFDYFSTLERKNPIGLIEAFKRAFSPNEGPRLLIKTMNEQYRRGPAAEVRSHVDGRGDIEIVERYLEPREITALIAGVGCYVSLHRSEGFGLTLIDSMALGTPVVTTGYSGNMDFTNERNSYLVDWTPTVVGPGSEVYPAGGTWAEPDLDHAAALMRQVWQHPDEATQKAERARRDVERLFAPAVVGRLARARLETLLELRREAPRSGRSAALTAIEQELKLDLRRGVPSRRAATGAVRQAVMRLMLPFTLHERNLDRAVLDALKELRSDLDRERARGARARARLRRVEDRLAGAKESPER